MKCDCIGGGGRIKDRSKRATERGASDAADKHIKDFHTKEQEAEFVNTSVDLNTWMSAVGTNPVTPTSPAVAL
jgi:hypothetical protein